MGSIGTEYDIAKSSIVPPPNPDKLGKYQPQPLWTGPSTITTIRVAKRSPTDSLLKSSYNGPSAIAKQHVDGPIALEKLGFVGDEQVYHEHGGPEKAVLQYNADHYIRWKEELTDVFTKDPNKRDQRLSAGGFGENMAVQNSTGGPNMDETTVCVGDLICIRKAGTIDTQGPKIRVTGPREPCLNLNHRFGVPNMSQRSQSTNRTGWLYSVEEEGYAQVGNELVLLERPFPEWPVARIQYYLYREPRNFEMIGELLSTLGDLLVFDVKRLFRNRFTKGIENMSLRLQGVENPGLQGEYFVKYRLTTRTPETKRVSIFTFQRVDILAAGDEGLMIAEPGSHIRLRFKLPSQTKLSLIRPYSIISGDSNQFKLGIALADKSRGGSSYLHQNLQVGDIVEVSDRFANTFPLQPASAADEHVFFAGGIGITAFLHHMKHCIDHGIRFHLHYMLRNSEDYAFKTVIESLLALESAHQHAKVSIYISSTGQRCNVHEVLAQVAGQAQTHVYVCGSEKLSEAIKRSAAALSITDQRLHFEQFSVDASGDPFEAHLAAAGKTVHIPGEQSLLDALRDAGFEVASGCEAGNCGTCRVTVKCGQVLHRGTGLMDDEKAGNGCADGEMLSCVSRGVGTISIEI